MEKKLSGEATPEQIEAWKKEHGDISAYTTPDNKIAYFKEPDRNILRMATDSVADGISQFTELVAENCFIGGDKSILTDAKYYNGLNKSMNKLAKGVEGELVKL